MLHYGFDTNKAYKEYSSIIKDEKKVIWIGKITY